MIRCARVLVIDRREDPACREFRRRIDVLPKPKPRDRFGETAAGLDRLQRELARRGDAVDEPRRAAIVGDDRALSIVGAMLQQPERHRAAAAFDRGGDSPLIAADQYSDL